MKALVPSVCFPVLIFAELWEKELRARVEEQGRGSGGGGGWRRLVLMPWRWLRVQTRVRHRKLFHLSPTGPDGGFCESQGKSDPPGITSGKWKFKRFGFKSNHGSLCAFTYRCINQICDISIHFIVSPWRPTSFHNASFFRHMKCRCTVEKRQKQ